MPEIRRQAFGLLAGPANGRLLRRAGSRPTRWRPLRLRAPRGSNDPLPGPESPGGCQCAGPSSPAGLPAGATDPTRRATGRSPFRSEHSLR